MKRIVLVSIIGIGSACWLQAQEADRPRRGKGCPGLREAHGENRELAREHRQAQREEGREFHEGLKEVEPDERWDKIIAFRMQQHGESKEFRAQQHDRVVTALKACEDMPAERKDEMLARMEKRHEEAVAFHDEIHAEVIAYLNELKASDAPPEEKREAWQTFNKGIRERVKQWREEHRPRRGGRGRGKPGRPDGRRGPGGGSREDE